MFDGQESCSWAGIEGTTKVEETEGGKGERSSKKSRRTMHEAEWGASVWAWCAATHHPMPGRATAAVV